MSYGQQNLTVPYRGHIQNGVFPGRMIRVQGVVSPMAQRFAINLQCGANTEPRDDIAIHFSPQFDSHKVIRNTLINLMWGPEESMGHFPFAPGQPFEVIILCEDSHYKIAINSNHYAEYEHRIAFQRVTHITIDGDIQLTTVRFEDPPPQTVPGMAAPPPSSGYIVPMTYEPQPAYYPSVNPPPYTVSAPAYAVQPQYESYSYGQNQSTGMSRTAAAATGALAGVAVGGLAGYAVSNAFHSSSSDSD